MNSFTSSSHQGFQYQPQEEIYKKLDDVLNIYRNEQVS
jgi:hypothetical protein